MSDEPWKKNHERASEKSCDEYSTSAEHSGEASVALGGAHCVVDRVAVGIFRGGSAQQIPALAACGGEFVHRAQRFRRIVDACPRQYSARFVGIRRWWRGGTHARVADRLAELG